MGAPFRPRTASTRDSKSSVHKRFSFMACSDWFRLVSKLGTLIDKTKVVFFNRKPQGYQATITLDKAELEYTSVPSYKYLGTILSSNGSFKIAISTLANQASKALGCRLHGGIFTKASVILETLFPLSKHRSYKYLMHALFPVPAFPRTHVYTP